MICLCLTGASLDEWTRQIDNHRPHVSLVELRVDLLRPAERSVEAIRAWREEFLRQLPIILTVRRPRDFGRWEGDDGQRLYLLTRLVDALKPEYLDLELDRQSGVDWVQLARRQEEYGGRVVRSYHGTVADRQELAQLMARLATSPREIPKLALDAQSLADTTMLFSAAREFARRMSGREAVWLAMNEYGLSSRVAPSHFGSVWTYTSDLSSATGPAAPGQLDPASAKQIYRPDQATSDWPLFGVLGSPVAHSRSPEYHNRRFAEAGCEAVYLPVRAETFAEFIDFAETVDLRGVSVTVPHKIAALELVQHEDQGGATERAARIGAVNTLWRDEKNRWYGDNTDVDGFLVPLEEAVGANGAGRHAAVIGAGGAARAVVVGLVDAGWTVDIYNRTPRRAQDLIDSLDFSSTESHGMEELRELAPGTLDLLVQTTPVGMDHGPAGDPAEGYRFSGTETVYDLIYAPRETALLARARAAGCRTINGDRMFAAQAEAQFVIFRSLLERGSQRRKST